MRHVGGCFVLEVAEGRDCGLDVFSAAGALDDVDECGDGLWVIGAGESFDEFVATFLFDVVGGEHGEETCCTADRRLRYTGAMRAAK